MSESPSLSDKLKLLIEHKSSLNLAIHQAGNTISVCQEAIVKFEKVLIELHEAAKALFAAEVTPIEDFKKAKSTIVNVKEYLKIQKAKAFSAMNEAKVYTKELSVVEKDIAFIELSLGTRGQVLNFKESNDQQK
jgi:hypothetical protein